MENTTLILSIVAIVIYFIILIGWLSLWSSRKNKNVGAEPTVDHNRKDLIVIDGQVYDPNNTDRKYGDGIGGGR